jgi:1-acyl-sn-glycerol-3-phosphate acyltransferase
VTFVIFPIVTLISSVFVIVCAYVKPNLVDIFIKAWAKLVCWMYGVRVTVYYPENIKPGGFLLLFNHSSFFDIFALSSVLPEIRFGAKKELFRIPFFGSAMKAVGVIPIERDQRDRAIETLRHNQHRLAKGTRVGLSPEGGRLGGEDFLSPFKSGPFYFALGARAPIQPVLIQGASLVWPKGSWMPAKTRWLSEIELVFLPQIQTTLYTFDQRNELKDYTFEVMHSALKQWRAKKCIS